MGREWLRVAVCASFCAGPIAASAQGILGETDAALGEYSTAVADRSLTLPRGVLEITAPLGVSLSSGSGGEPTFLNPSISYGLSDQLTVGIRHFLGMCFSGEDGNCPEFYNDISFDALYLMVASGRLEIAAGAALNLAPITDPTAVSGELRVPIKFGGGKLALVLSPTLNFGLNERDDGPKRYGLTFNAGTYDIIIPAETLPNREVLRVPLTVQLQPTMDLAVLAGASVDGALDPAVGSFSDVYRIPVMFGAMFTPSRSFDVGAALTFPDLMGQDGTADDRLLSAFVALRI
jgi:hypothetical protein